STARAWPARSTCTSTEGSRRGVTRPAARVGTGRSAEAPGGRVRAGSGEGVDADRVSGARRLRRGNGGGGGGGGPLGLAPRRLRFGVDAAPAEPPPGRAPAAEAGRSAQAALRLREPRARRPLRSRVP